MVTNEKQHMLRLVIVSVSEHPLQLHCHAAHVLHNALAKNLQAYIV
jgi:hypothetical protein